MGYTHYWRNPKTVGTKKWEDFTADCKKIFDYAQRELGIALADGLGTPNTQPIIDDDKVIFNGSDAQPTGVWTTTEKLSIPWPSDMAGIKELNEMPFEKTDGNWFGGTLLTQRTAPVGNSDVGSGSFETVVIDRNKTGFSFCKTAYRPYDLVLTAVLIAFQHHNPHAKLSSDGEEKDWVDGRLLCFNVLGYGMDEKINEDED